MMKRVIAVAAVSIVCGAHAVGAAESRINLSADVPTYCAITPILGASDLDKIIPINPANGAVDTTEFSVEYSVQCNGDTKLYLDSQNGGLWRGSADAVANFDNHINYTVRTGGPLLTAPGIVGSTSDIPAFGTAENLGERNLIGNAVNGNLLIRIQPESNSNPLLGGHYSDVLVVTLDAQ